MEPIRYEDGVAVFTNEQIDIWGEPDQKFQNYYVVDGQPDYMTSYAAKDQSYLKAIHRYDRVARFDKTLHTLLGECTFDMKVKIATMTEMLNIVKTYVKDDSTNSYEETRKIFIHYGYKRFIPFIPTILIMTRKPFPLKIDRKNLSETIQLVKEDFKMLERRFFREDGYKGERKYFPNLRYIAIKLLINRGVENVCMPLLRTKRKLVAMDLVFQKLLNK